MSILNPKNIPLSPSVTQLLDSIFSSTQEVVIQAELKPGIGNSHIFVLMAKNDEVTRYLVVKIASTRLVQREWNAYQQHIPKKLKGITEIQSRPVFLPSGDIGGLIYPLIGDNKYKVESLLNYCKNTDFKDIIYDIFEDELFENLQFLWGRGSLKSNYNFLDHYSHLLPYYVIVEERTPPSNIVVHNIDMNHISDYVLNQGDYVCLTKGQINSTNPSENSFTIKPVGNNLGSSILWKSKHHIPLEQVGKIIEFPLTGIIEKTRYEQIIENVKVIFQESFDVAAQSIKLANSVSIPNPLMYINFILRKSINVRFACIHGDLHLENILVEHSKDIIGGRNHIAHLIDFDSSRRDHVLRDPLKLETDIMTRLLPDMLVEASLPVETIHGFYYQLHNAIVHGEYNLSSRFLQKPFHILLSLRKLAQYYLFDPNDWSEYYYGLFLYLVGSLKFKNLDTVDITVPSPKAIAFLGAATILALLLDTK